MPATDSRSIAILGAGITGLVAAHRLVRQGHHVRIFEQSGRAGGAIRTEESNGWLIESGPNSLLGGEPAVDRLIAELGLSSEILRPRPSSKKRYIVRRGQLVAAPLSPPALLRTSLFSFPGKIRILAELSARRRVRTSDVSLADFMANHFGQEFVDYAVDPLVSGVYAGNPAKLSARFAFPKLWKIEQTHGSLLRGQIAAARERRARGESPPAIFTFAHGVQTLTDALASRLPRDSIILNASLQAITPGPPWSVVWQDGATTRTQSFDAIVLALPAHALAKLRIGALGERPLAALDSIEHPPVASVFLGYRSDQVAHPLDGFGVLMPSVEKRTALGILFSSSLFSGRAPEACVALTVIVGGTRQPHLAELSTEEIIKRVGPDLTQLLGVTGEPVFHRRTFWPRAIPQYNLGHEHHLAAMALTERNHPGLFIGGQARDGISVPACVQAGESLADRCGA